MSKNESRIKVLKGENGFNKALEQGFAVNTYLCGDNEIILVLPVDNASMRHYVNKAGWVIVE